MIRHKQNNKVKLRKFIKSPRFAIELSRAMTKANNFIASLPKGYGRSRNYQAWRPWKT